MRRTAIWVVALTLGGATLVGLLLRAALAGLGVSPGHETWLAWVALLLMSAILFGMGLQVKRYLNGDKPDLDGLRAWRTCVLAKAGAITGAVLAGWYLSAVIRVLGDLQWPGPRHRAIMAGIAVLCAIVLMVVGLLVEKMCQIPPADTEDSHASDAAPA